MTTFHEVENIFKKCHIWNDDPAEFFWYRWVWNRITSILNTDDVAQGCVDAVTLSYIYTEFAFQFTGVNYHEDVWDVMDEFADGLALGLGFLCGRIGDWYPENEKNAMQYLTQLNHGRMVKVMKSIDTMKLLTAFHASYAKPKRLAFDEDGDEEEKEMLVDYGSFCRYITDADFRDEDIYGMSESDYEAAYDWWESGAEMLDARTASDDL